MSTHRVDIVPIALREHPNADSLSIVDVFGWTCCVRTEDWLDRDRGAYIAPDSLVDTTRPEFTFLAEKARPDGRHRVRVVRLRGVISQGLLIPAPPGASLGDDVAEALGVTRYQPPEDARVGGESEPPPPGWRPTYDVENWHRYPGVLRDGEEVVVTEKLHGTSARWTYQAGRFWVGSRNEWKRESAGNAYWRALRENPWLAAFCEANPGLTVYGEVFGWIQNLRYGANAGQVFARVFDLWDGGRWLDVDEGHALGADLVWVPRLYRGPYAEGIVRDLANGASTLAAAGHLREGIVVKPTVERTDPTIGRVQFKLVSDDFLMSKAG